MANIKYKDSFATLHLGSTAGTELTDAEQNRGEEAALNVLGDRAVEAYQGSLAASSDDPHDVGLAKLWDDAETAAIRAACAGWAQYPEDLDLELHGVD